MPFFNILSEQIDRAKAKAGQPMPSRPTQRTGAPPPPKKDFGPSKDPAIIAAAEAARKRSEANLRRK